jgi:Ca2+-dependent lipid-binding protein
VKWARGRQQIQAQQVRTDIVNSRFDKTLAPSKNAVDFCQKIVAFLAGKMNSFFDKKWVFDFVGSGLIVVKNVFVVKTCFDSVPYKDRPNDRAPESDRCLTGVDDRS